MNAPDLMLFKTYPIREEMERREYWKPAVLGTFKPVVNRRAALRKGINYPYSAAFNAHHPKRQEKIGRFCTGSNTIKTHKSPNPKKRPTIVIPEQSDYGVHSSPLSRRRSRSWSPHAHR
jgi:hypothetical protein